MNDRSRNPRNLWLLAGALLLASAPPALAQVTVDPGGVVGAACGLAGDPPCALLADGIAVAAAGDTITVAGGTYTKSGLLLDFDVTIEAAAGAIPVIDAGGADRHFVIAGTAANPLTSVTLHGLVLQNGLRTNGRGGAIKASWVNDLAITDVTFETNIANDGGAIAASGSNVTITGSEFRNNAASQFGGAVFFVAQGNGTDLTISRTKLADNLATEGGGVFKRSGDLKMIESSFHDNIAGNSATFTVLRSTVS